MTIKISIEGGGDRRGQQAPLREAFSKLFASAGIAGSLPSVECNGSRNEAEKAFQRHRRSLSDKALLLVDAEGPVDDGVVAWKFLKQRDPWALDASMHNQIHLMVQLMESWFLADRRAMAEYFGDRFHANKLPGTERDIESIPKLDVERGVEAATKDTKKGGYNKGAHSADLLSRLSVSKIEAASPHAKRFFDRLRELAR